MIRRIGLSLLSLWLTASCATQGARAQGVDLTATVGWALTVVSGAGGQVATGTPSSNALATATPWPTTSITQIPPATTAPVGTGTPGSNAAGSLAASVNVRLLSCRYGPGPEYLYLYALRSGANIKLIGRTDGANWHWAWVDGRNPCWVNVNYLTIKGDWRQLPIVYPGIAKLPVSPYYPPSAITKVTRSGNVVTVRWLEIPLRAGDEEDDSMQHYIVEAWHCRGGTLLFEPLATNDSVMNIIDEPGCTQPSHARLFVQEKHGFSGPTNIPWPAP